jgi:hypothetical protein
MWNRVAISVALLVLFGYGLIEAAPLVRGPSLALSVSQDASTTPSVVTISGTAARVTELTLNGAPLLPDESGAYSKVIVLPRGGSILSLTASDRFGRSITKQETVYVP